MNVREKGGRTCINVGSEKEKLTSSIRNGEIN